MAEVTHVLSGLVWSYGEIKEVDPEWTIRVRVDGQPVNVQVVDDLLSSGEYVEVGTDGKPVAPAAAVPAAEEAAAATQDETPSADPDN
jgi:hypothetical protein